MKFVQRKLFINSLNEGLIMKTVPDGDYYAFVCKEMKSGLSQIVISSDIMVEILKFFFIEKKAKIVEIDFLEDDKSYKDQFSKLVNEANNDRAYFFKLLEELSFLSMQKTIDIKSIRLKFRKNELPIDIMISVNGLITIGENLEAQSELDFLNDFIWENVKSWI